MTTSGSAGVPLVGRGREREVLQDFVRRAADGDGGALLVSGEAGVGKTALLTATAARARHDGTRVLRVTGAEFEGAFAFAGLQRVVLPLLDDIQPLDALLKDALATVMGPGAYVAADRMVLSAAVAMLFRRAAQRVPLLLVVDDAGWLDAASAGVLSAVARRFADSRAGFLAASRTESWGFFDRSGLTVLTVPSLTDAAADELLTTHFPELDALVRARVRATAQGNPLALLELPRALSEPQRSATTLPEVLPLGGRLNEIFAGRIDRLPSATRELLLAAALEGTGDPAELDVAGAGRFGLADLDAAERADLARIDAASQRIVFRHPLVRAAVVEASTAQERRRTHRALAAALLDQPNRRARHLAEASVEPDEQVAALLEDAARSVLRRGDPGTAVKMLCRAADLSPGSTERSRRLAEAAYIGAEAMGEVESIAELLERGRRVSRTVSASLHYASAAALVMLGGDTPVDAVHRLLVAAIESGDHRYDAADPELINALWTLALVCYFGGRGELWAPLHTSMARLSPAPPQLLSLTIDMFADPVRTGVAALPRLRAALDLVHDEVDIAYVQNIAGATMYADLLAEIREPLWRTVRQGRLGGPRRRYLVALMDLCVDDFHRGAWDEAADLAAEGLALTQERGSTLFAWYFRYHQALLAAVRDSSAAGREIAQQIIGWAEPRGLGTAKVYAHHALVLADLAAGEHASAYQHAIAVSPPGVLPSHVPHALWIAMDLVEAAVRTGRQSEAERHVQALRDADIAALSPRLALLEAGASGIAASGAAARAHFERALALPLIDRWPFDAARVRLAYGQQLRRTRATADARFHLTAALTTFDRLGASAWANQARGELRATGVHRNVRQSGDSLPLTAQQLQIAQLAASGLTNKQIGERLFLSPRTVSGHLYQIFPKLGVTTRAALRDALGGDDAGVRT